MKQHLILATILALSTAPAVAQSTNDEGFSLVEEGAKLILRGLMEEMEPAIDDMRSMMEDFGPAMEDFVVQLGPVLSQLLQQVDDLRHYDQPRILPNGDILIPRSPDAPVWTPDAPEPGEEIDL